MSDNPVVKLVEEQEWLKPIGEKSDALVQGAVEAIGDAGQTAKDVLINSRLLGHKRHPTITDVPFGSWTVTLVADVLEATGKKQLRAAGDTSAAVGFVASLIASLGGLADLSETHGEADRSLGMMHGMFQGLTTALYGGSLVARKLDNRIVGRALSFAGYGTLILSSYFAAKLVEKRGDQASS